MIKRFLILLLAGCPKGSDTGPTSHPDTGVTNETGALDDTSSTDTAETGGTDETGDSGKPPDTGETEDTGILPAEPPYSIYWTGGYGIFNERLGMSLAAASENSFPVAFGAPANGRMLDIQGSPETYLLDAFTGSFSDDVVGKLSGFYDDGSGYGAYPRLGTKVVIPGDITGDGEIDVVPFNDPDDGDLPEPAYVFPGPFAGGEFLSVMDPEVIPISGLDGWDGAYCGDLDGNGVDELCLTSGVLFGPIDATTVPTLTWSGVDAAEAQIMAGDLDGDGSNELFLWDASAAAVYRLSSFSEGDVDLAVSAAATWTASEGEVTAMLAGEDLDGDGSGDLVVAWTDGTSRQVYVLTDPNGGALADARTSIELPAEDLAVGDLDGDGAFDLVVGGEDSVWVFTGPLSPGKLGQGHASAWWTTDEDPEDRFGWSLLTFDIDADGRDELFVGAPGGEGHNLPDTECGRVYMIPGGSL